MPATQMARSRPTAAAPGQRSRKPRPAQRYQQPWRLRGWQAGEAPQQPLLTQAGLG